MAAPQIDDYVLHDLIGESTTGQVWSADYQEQSPLAIKVLNPGAINRQFIFDTLVKVLNGAPHPGLNGIYDFDLASETPYITTALHADRVALDNGTEYWQPRSLEPLCGQMDSEESWNYICHIAEALSHLHRLRASHTGLKPANILLDNESPPNIKITDIGMGIVGGSEKIAASDTLCYAPPEQLRAPDQHLEGSGERWDVYSFGVAAFRLMTGQFPRLNTFINELRRRRASNPEKAVMIDLHTLATTLDKQPAVNWPVAATDPTEEKRRQIIEACLEIDPTHRFVDMRDVREAIQALDDSLRFSGDRHATAPVSGKTGPSDETTPRKQSKLPLFIGAGCAAMAGLLIVGHLRDGGISKLWSALKLEKSDTQPNIRIDDNGDLVEDDPPPVNNGDPATTSNNEVVKQDNLAGELLEELRMTSETVDEVFRSLVARDSSGSAVFAVPDGALGSILAYYEDFAQRHQSNPALVLEAARAYNSAGEIKLALNDTPGAIQSIESAALMLEPAYKANPDNGELLLWLAFFKRNLAEAQAAARLPKTSLASARASAELFEKLAERNQSSPQAQRSLVQSYLSLGNALSNNGSFGEADLILDRALSVLGKLAKSDGQNETDIAALAWIEYERALLEFRRKNTKNATTQLIASIDRLLDPLIKSDPDSVLYRSRLATSYGLLADVLFDGGGPKEAEEANNQAIALYAELTEEFPERTEYRSQLAGRFMTLAETERDAGKNEDALAAANKALTILDDLVRRSPENPRNKFDMAICYRLIADLQLDAMKKKEALESGNEALKIVQDLLKEDTDPENGNAKRPEYRMTMAEFYDALGHQCKEFEGYKDDAKTCFEKAVTHFEYLATDPDWPDQETVQKALAESKASLAEMN